MLPGIPLKHIVRVKSLPEESSRGCGAGGGGSPSGMLAVVVLCRELFAKTEIGPQGCPAFGDPVSAAERAVMSRLGAEAVGLHSTTSK